MTRNQNHDDDASSGITIKTCDPWSDLNHDILLLVMMKIGAIDFLAFSGVCKSWRSLAISNRNKFMASRAPMSVCVSSDTNEKNCYLEDSEGRKFKTTLPHSSGSTCVGLTCGYLILFGKKSNDFWLVNPITRHELHFPAAPSDDIHRKEYFSVILVFSPSESEWVLVVFTRFIYYSKIWFCIAGLQEWTHVSTLDPIRDLHAFKGKIYVIHSDSCLSEVRLYPTPKVTSLEIKNFPKPDFDIPVLVSLGENLYVMDLFYKHACKIINSSKVEWVSMENIEDEFTLYFSKSMPGASIISDIPSQYQRYAGTFNGRERKIYCAKMWYFFHNCLNANLLVE